jgi:hypothetical protein
MTLRCLIVDDSPRFLGAAHDHLQRQGIVVVGVASSIGEALQQAERLRPDGCGRTSPWSTSTWPARAASSCPGGSGSRAARRWRR